MSQADVDARFTLLMTELVTTTQGGHGAVAPEHMRRIKFELLEKLVSARDANRRGRRLTERQVDQLCDIFTDITGIEIPA